MRKATILITNLESESYHTKIALENLVKKGYIEVIELSKLTKEEIEALKVNYQNNSKLKEKILEEQRKEVMEVKIVETQYQRDFMVKDSQPWRKKNKNNSKYF